MSSSPAAVASSLVAVSPPSTSPTTATATAAVGIVVVEDDAAIATNAENWHATHHQHRKTKKHNTTPPEESLTLEGAASIIANQFEVNNQIQNDPFRDGGVIRMTLERDEAEAAAEALEAAAAAAGNNNNTYNGNNTINNTTTTTTTTIGSYHQASNNNNANNTINTNANTADAAIVGASAAASSLYNVPSVPLPVTDENANYYELPTTDILRRLLSTQPGYSHVAKQQQQQQQQPQRTNAPRTIITSDSSGSTIRTAGGPLSSPLSPSSVAPATATASPAATTSASSLTSTIALRTNVNKADMRNRELAHVGVGGGARQPSSAAVALELQQTVDRHAATAIYMAPEGVERGASAIVVGLPSATAVGGGGGGGGDSTATVVLPSNGTALVAVTSASSPSPSPSPSSLPPPTLVAGSVVPSRFLRRVRCQWDSRRELQEILIRFRESITCIHAHATTHYHLWEEALYEIYAITGSTRSRIRARLPKRAWQIERERQRREDREKLRLQRLANGEYLYSIEEEEERLRQEQEEEDNPPLPDREEVEHASKLFERAIRRCKELFEELATHIGGFTDRFIQLMRMVNAEVGAIDWLNSFEEMLEIFEHRLPTFHNDSLLDFAMEVPPTIMEGAKLSITELNCFSADAHREKVRPNEVIPVDFGVSLKSKVTFEAIKAQEAADAAAAIVLAERQREEAAAAAAAQAAADLAAAAASHHHAKGAGRSGSPTGAGGKRGASSVSPARGGGAAANAASKAGGAAAAAAAAAKSTASLLERKPSGTGSTTSALGGGGGGGKGSAGASPGARSSSSASKASGGATAAGAQQQRRMSATGGGQRGGSRGGSDQPDPSSANGGGGGGRPPAHGRRASMAATSPLTSALGGNTNTGNIAEPAEGAAAAAAAATSPPPPIVNNSASAIALRKLGYGVDSHHGVSSVDEKDTATYRALRTGLIENARLAAIGGSGGATSAHTTNTSAAADAATTAAAVRKHTSSRHALLSALPYKCDIVAACADHTDPFLRTLYIATSNGAVLSLPFSSVASLGDRKVKGGAADADAAVKGAGDGEPPKKKESGEAEVVVNVIPAAAGRSAAQQRQRPLSPPAATAAGTATPASPTTALGHDGDSGAAKESSSSTTTAAVFERTRAAIGRLLTGYPFPLPTPTLPPPTAAALASAANASGVDVSTDAAATSSVTRGNSVSSGAAARRTSSSGTLNGRKGTGGSARAATQQQQQQDPKAAAKAERLRKQEEAAAVIRREKEAKQAALDAIKAEAAARLPIKVPLEYQAMYEREAAAAAAAAAAATAAEQGAGGLVPVASSATPSSNSIDNRRVSTTSSYAAANTVISASATPANNRSFSNAPAPLPSDLSTASSSAPNANNTNGKKSGAASSPPPTFIDGVRLFEGHMYSVHLLEYLPSLGLLISAAADKTLRIHDAASGRLINVIAELRGLPSCVCYHRDLEAIVVGTYAGELVMFDPRTKGVVGRMHFAQPIHSLCFDAVLSVLFVGTRRGHIYGFKLSLDAQFYRPRLEPLDDVSQSQDCVYCLLPAAEANSPLAYPIDRNSCTVSIQQGEGCPTAAPSHSSAVQRNGAAVSGANGLIFNTATTAKAPSLGRSTATTRMISVAFYLFAGDATGRIHQWDLVTGEYVRKYHSHSDDITDLVVTLDGIMFSTAKDALVVVWSTVDGSCLKTVNRHYGAVSGLFIGYLGGDHTPDGQQQQGGGGGGDGAASGPSTGGNTAPTTNANNVNNGAKGPSAAAAIVSTSINTTSGGISSTTIGNNTSTVGQKTDATAGPGLNIYTQRRLHGGASSSAALYSVGGVGIDDDDDSSSFGGGGRSLMGGLAGSRGMGGGTPQRPSSRQTDHSPVADSRTLASAPVARPFMMIPNYVDDTEVQQAYAAGGDAQEEGGAQQQQGRQSPQRRPASAASRSPLSSAQQRQHRSTVPQSTVTGFTVGPAGGGTQHANAAAIGLSLLKGEVPQGVDMRALQGSRECVRVTVHNPPVVVTTSWDESVVTWGIAYND